MNEPIRFTLTDDESGEETEHSLPSRWDICGRCRGSGKHDHPAFSNGLTQEDFAEDPDFKEDYMEGRYDVSCSECGGTGKVLVPDEAAMNPEQLRLLAVYEQQCSEMARDAAADAYTRRMESGGY